MARPHIEFIQALEVAPHAVGDPQLAGAVIRVLSKDDSEDASTELWSLPEGWSGELLRDGRRIELFVLTGAVLLDGQTLDHGCYAHLPPGAQAAELAASEPSQVLVMVDPAGESAGEQIEVLDTKLMRWAASSFASVPAGLVNKRLRDDPHTGERTWIAACTPGWLEDRAEVHPTVEESLLLRGDILLGSCGVMGPGCYFWRPPMVPHGPMYSRGGAEFFFRTKGGALQVDYRSVPGWERMVGDYRGAERGYPIPAG
jgi:hypothetical protein